MRIKALERYRNPYSRGFDDLPPLVRRNAYGWLTLFEERWRGNLPSWRRAILIGQARRLAKDPPSSEWGRRLLATRGGYAVQEKYRLEGRVGKKHPAHYAAKVSASQRRLRKQRQVDAELRARLGLPPPPRSKYNPVG